MFHLNQNSPDPAWTGHGHVCKLLSQLAVLFTEAVVFAEVMVFTAQGAGRHALGSEANAMLR
jgi:hypothetical protein